MYIYAAARTLAQPGVRVGVVDSHKKRNFFGQLFVQNFLLTFSRNRGIIVSVKGERKEQPKASLDGELVQIQCGDAHEPLKKK